MSSGSKLGTRNFSTYASKTWVSTAPSMLIVGPTPPRPERADGRDVAPLVERFADFCALSLWGSRVSGRHRQIGAEFVNEDQLLNGQPFLLSCELSSFYRIGLFRSDSLFFRDRPSDCRARQIVGMLTSTRAFFFIRSRNSLSVASGDWATKSVKIIN